MKFYDSLLYGGKCDDDTRIPPCHDATYLSGVCHRSLSKYDFRGLIPFSLGCSAPQLWKVLEARLRQCYDGDVTVPCILVSRQYYP